MCQYQTPATPIFLPIAYQYAINHLMIENNNNKRIVHLK